MDSGKNMADLLKVSNEADLQQASFYEELRKRVNYLLVHDFSALVQALYRVDVSEQKLKQLLQQRQDEEAAVIITELIIERQLQKIKARQSFSPPENDSEEERW